MIKFDWQKKLLYLPPLFLVVAGSLYRYFGMQNLGFYFDTITTQFEWGKSAFEIGGPLAFWQNYPLTKFYDYPPLSLVYEWLLASVTSQVVGLDADTGGKFFVSLLKGFNWLVDIIFSLILIFLGNKYSSLKNWQLYLVSSLVYCLPAFWFVSGVWGQNDTLVALLTFFSLYFLFQNNLQNNLENNLQNSDQNISQNPTNSQTQTQKLNNSASKQPFWQNNFQNNFLWSGILLALAYNIKQQPLLILPALVLFFIQGRSIKEVLTSFVLVIAGLFPWLYLIDLYAKNYEKYDLTKNLSALGLTQPIQTSLIAINVYSLLYLLIMVALTVFLNPKSKTGSYQNPFKYLPLNSNLVSFLLGFYLVFSLIQIPLGYLNPIRSIQILATSSTRDNNVSEGADTFWTLLDPNFVRSSDTAFDPLIQGSIGSISIANLSNFFYLVCMAILCWFLLGLNFKLAFLWQNNLNSTWQNTFDIKKTILQLFREIQGGLLQKLITFKFTIFEACQLLSLSTFAVFLFTTKIHSRYLHLGLVFMFITYFVWPQNPQNSNTNNNLRLQWLLATIFVSIPYFLNQVWVLGYTNNQPSWVKDWMGATNFEIGNLNSTLYILGFVWVFSIAIRSFTKSTGKWQKN